MFWTHTINEGHNRERKDFSFSFLADYIYKCASRDWRLSITCFVYNQEFDNSFKRIFTCLMYICRYFLLHEIYFILTAGDIYKFIFFAFWQLNTRQQMSKCEHQWYRNLCNHHLSFFIICLCMTIVPCWHGTLCQSHQCQNISLN